MKIPHKIEEVIRDSEEQVIECVKKAQQNEMAVLPGLTLTETFESKVNAALNKCITNPASRQQALDHLNNEVHGHGRLQGSALNISQMMACWPAKCRGKALNLLFETEHYHTSRSSIWVLNHWIRTESYYVA